MSLKNAKTLMGGLSIFLLAILACSLPGVAPEVQQPQNAPPEVIVIQVTATTESSPVPPTASATATITHITMPSSPPAGGRLVYDVESSGTAPEKRAPYGDSYKINRFERPFQQDMSYIQDMDIASYTVKEDGTWIYVSVELIGTDPNNSLGINYGVELDTNSDGFGDFIVWARPPYSPQWDASNVQVFADKNRNTGGLSAEKSDAPLTADGYETKIFDGGIGDDPDLAWVRAYAGRQATLQFAFKASLAGGRYMLGVVSDAGLRDVTKMDYNDRFTEEEAGSPEKSEKYYPLKALYAVDNACREAFGFQPTGYEPQLCPREEPTPKPRATQVTCPPPPPSLTHVCVWDPVACRCSNLP